MGINRSSMYAAFGDKEELFALAVGRYRDGPMSYIRQALEQPTVRGVIEGLLYGTVEFLKTPGNPHGCLSIQGALACGTDADPVKQAMIEWRKKGEAVIKKRLAQAQKDGDLRGNPADVTRYISTVMAGLSVQAVNGASEAEMKRIADMTIEFMACSHLL
jgi:AcrR family transcriptional regulator